jgi:uncharacterized membrane protein (UPF0127 family)
MRKQSLRRLAALLAFVLVAAGCAGTSLPRTTATSTTDNASRPATEQTSASSHRPLPSPIAAWPVIGIEISGRPLTVVVAVDKQQGLMAVSELPVDGMLFDYGDEVDAADHQFWMRNVVIPLDVTFFDSAGAYVSRTEMPICSTDPCPTYAATGRYRWALETPHDRQVSAQPGDRLVLRATSLRAGFTR